MTSLCASTTSPSDDPVETGGTDRGPWRDSIFIGLCFISLLFEMI